MPWKQRLLSRLHPILLWISIVILGIISSFALITSSTRSSCISDLATNANFNDSESAFLGTQLSIQAQKCTAKEIISEQVYHNASYISSIHVIVLQFVASMSLLTFKPSLLDTIWSALGKQNSPLGKPSPKITLDAMQSGVELVNSPALGPACRYTYKTKSAGYPVVFVLLISIVSILCPVVVAPIYRPHNGPYTVNTTVVVGGGVGRAIDKAFFPSGPVANGIMAGRALLNAETLLGIPVPSTTFNISVTPFIPRDTITAIWSANIETVVAYNEVDCGPTAPAQLSASIENLVDIETDPYFYREALPSNVTIDGTMVGYITNDPQISVAYLNWVNSAPPGSVTGQTSIVFLAANGNLEGAQHKIVSPRNASLISFVDVLVCTSTTSLVVSECFIQQGNLTSCSPIPSGNVSNYISSPKTVSVFLSASPATAFYNLGGRLPMYSSLDSTLISSQISPLPYLTYDTPSRGIYFVSQEYIKNALFGKTAQGLVQGILSTYQVNAPYNLKLYTVFGTSNAILIYITMAVALIFATMATLASMRSQNALPLDIARIIATSQNPQLTTRFQDYSDGRETAGREVGRSYVTYEKSTELNRHVLFVAGPNAARPQSSRSSGAGGRGSNWDSELASTSAESTIELRPLIH